MVRSAAAVSGSFLALLGAADGGGNAVAQAPPSRLEHRLLAALSHDDLGFRLEAIRFLGYRRARHVAALGALAEDPDHRVRRQVYEALGSIGWGDPAARALVAPFLQTGLRDGVRSNRETAIHCCSAAEATDWTELEGCLADPSDRVRVLAALALGRLQMPVAGRDLHDLLAIGPGRLVAMLLPELDDPSERALLAPFLACPEPSTREFARQAAERLDAIAAGAPREWLPDAARRRERYRAENQAGLDRLSAAEWTAIDREELAERVARARLVLFGEVHYPDGPLRTAQRELLTAFAGDRPGDAVLGFEPSVASAQQSVIAFAAENGIATRALEPSYQDLLPRGLHAERDDEVAREINACLAERPWRRMFVIRGEAHTVPDGYLCRQLRTEPLIVLSSMSPPLEALGDDPDTVDRTWRVGGADSRTFYCGVDEPMALSDRFRAWLTE